MLNEVEILKMMGKGKHVGSVRFIQITKTLNLQWFLASQSIWRPSHARSQQNLHRTNVPRQIPQSGRISSERESHTQIPRFCLPRQKKKKTWQHHQKDKRHHDGAHALSGLSVAATEPQRLRDEHDNNLDEHTRECQHRREFSHCGG